MIPGSSYGLPNPYSTQGSAGGTTALRRAFAQSLCAESRVEPRVEPSDATVDG